MVKYRLYDMYEEKEKIGDYNNLNSVKKAAREWDKDTDGENFLVLYKEGEDGKLYRFEDWGY